MKIGLISDTHGLVRPEAAAALVGSDLILHAGDIGKPEVLEQLEAIAPLRAIRGNVDAGEWAADLPDDEVVVLGDTFIYMLHDVNALDLDPEAAGFQVVLSGHSHQPSVERRGEVLFVNPGSAGPRRFSLPISLGWLDLTGARPEARWERLLD